MIVCVCKRVSERELEAAMAEGASTVKALSRKTGCGTQCGRCVPTVREMLQHETALPMVGANSFTNPVLATIANA